MARYDLPLERGQVLGPHSHAGLLMDGTLMTNPMHLP